MATIQRLESPNDATIGGVLITYPSGATKALHWRQDAPIAEPMAVAKDYAAKLLQERLDARQVDDAERTNWPSVAAAIQRHILDWNELTRARLRVVDNSATEPTKH